MMLDWNDYLAQVRKTTATLARLSPRILRGYRELSDAGNETNHLDPKTRELIALAVGVTRQCDGCIAVHVEAALKHGATSGEIAETLGVTISVNAGAAARLLHESARRGGRVEARCRFHVILGIGGDGGNGSHTEARSHGDARRASGIERLLRCPVWPALGPARERTRLRSHAYQPSFTMHVIAASFAPLPRVRAAHRAAPCVLRGSVPSV